MSLVLLKPYRDLLSTYLKPHRRQVAALAALLLGGIGLSLVSPQIVRYFIDTAQAGGAPRTLALAATLFLLVALLAQVVAVAETYAAENLGWTATNALRADLARHCLELDLSFHNAHTPGELIERIDGDVTILANFFSRFVLQVVGSLLLLAGVLVLLCREDWRIGLVLLAFSVVALAVMNRVRGAGARYSLATRAASADLFGFLEERLAGLADIHSAGAQEYVMRRSSRHLRALFERGRAAMLLGGLLGGATVAIFTLGSALALALGALSYRAGALSIGAVYLIFQYTAMLRQPLDQLTRQARDFQQASAGIARVRQLYDTRRTILDGPGAALPPGPLAVEFAAVSFRYIPYASPGTDGARDATEPVLREVSFHLPPGKVLGLLGRTGSGKTTLSRLLLRLYDADVGAIRLGGVDVRQLRLADLRRRVGLVTQEVQLFRGTVRDNLALFDRGIADDRIVAVLGDLGLAAWYLALPSGLDSELASGGGGLSAGEAQLLAFARVFLRDPDLVILDEASSRLDPVTERLLERAVDTLLAGRTGIVIAHRLATVARADEIMILDGGHAVEYGPRERLASDPASRFAHLLRFGIEEVLA